MYLTCPESRLNKYIFVCRNWVPDFIDFGLYLRKMIGFSIRDNFVEREDDISVLASNLLIFGSEFRGTYIMSFKLTPDQC